MAPWQRPPGKREGSALSLTPRAPVSSWTQAVSSRATGERPPSPTCSYSAEPRPQLGFAILVCKEEAIGFEPSLWEKTKGLSCLEPASNPAIQGALSFPLRKPRVLLCVRSAWLRGNGLLLCASPAAVYTVMHPRRCLTISPPTGGDFGHLVAHQSPGTHFHMSLSET